MKKSLSLLLALAMVFGMFASMASAADPALTTEQKLQQLVDLKILKGKPDGKPHLEDNLTRAEFATIAIAVAGVAEDTTTASAFSDVKAGEWHTGAITAANKAGFVEGVGGGLFAPKATITVQEIVKVAAAIAKLTPVEGATVDGAAAWAAPYIKAAQDAGLPVPTNYTANATRGQTIELAYAVYQALQVKPLSDAKATVNADDTITVTGKTAGGVDSVKVAIGTAEAAAATLNADGTFTYTTAKQAVGDYKLTVTAYKGTASVASTELTAKIDGFTVASVTVLNGKQIAVTFNKAVKEGSTEGAVKYKNGSGDYYYSLEGQNVSTVTDAAPSLSDDKKTITITFDHFTLDRYAQFKIAKGLKAASGQELGEFKQAVYLTDKTAPSVKGVSYSGKDAVIEFSEPLSNIGAVSIDGVQISEGTTADSSIVYELDPNKDITTDFNKVKIHNLEVDTSYTVDIVSAKDVAGNYLNYTGTLKVTSDNTPPTVSSLTVDGTTVSVKFSEALQDKKATLTVVDGADYEVDSYDGDTNVAKFKLADIVGDKSFVSVTVYFKADSFQDLQGNPNKATSKQTITLKADKTAPTFKSVSTDGAKIIVKYSEEINADALTALDYKFSDDNGVLKSGALSFTADVGYDVNDDGDLSDSEEKNYVVITVSTPDLLNGSSTLKAGKYTITIPSGAIKDTSPAANEASKVTLNFTVSGSSSKAAVKLLDVTQDPTNNSKIIFEFDTKLNKSQFDGNKFLMAGSALPSGTSFSFADDAQKIVVAELPSGAIAVSGKRDFKVKGIVADNGNTMNTDNDTIKEVDLIENKAPVAVSATLLDDQTISVSFSEALDNPTSFDGISIKINGNLLASDKIQTVTANNKTLLIEVKDGGTFKADQTVEVIFDGADGIIDLAGNAAANKSITIK